MSSLADKAADSLNQAKLSSSAKDKLFSLEQIKEIILHRDQSLFPTFIEDITDFVIDKSVAVRKFLAAFGGEVISKFPQHVPAILKLFGFLISDENDSVVRLVVLEMTRHYGRIAMHIIGLDSRAYQSFFVKSSKNQTPKELWEMLKGIENTALKILSTTRSKSLRAQCIRFMSSMLLFSLPLEAFSAERSSKRFKSENQSAYNVVAVSLHHAFLNKEQIEEEARAVLNKLIIWATRWGPHGAHFDDEQMGELAEVLAEVATQRPREMSSILPAIIFLVLAIAGEGEKPLKPPEELKAGFIDLATHLAESADVKEGGDKLRDALAALSAKTAIVSSSAALLTNLLQMNEDEEDEDEDMGELADGVDDFDDDENDLLIRNRAIAAINSIQATSGEGSAGSKGSNGWVSGGGSAGKDDSAGGQRVIRDTVLAEDAPPFPSGSVTLLWSLTGGEGITAQDITFKAGSVQTELGVDGFFGVSLSHLQNLLVDGLPASANMHEEVR